MLAGKKFCELCGRKDNEEMEESLGTKRVIRICMTDVKEMWKS
jgi:hypothetical protein